MHYVAVTAYALGMGIRKSVPTGFDLDTYLIPTPGVRRISTRSGFSVPGPLGGPDWHAPSRGPGYRSCVTLAQTDSFLASEHPSVAFPNSFTRVPEFHPDVAKKAVEIALAEAKGEVREIGDEVHGPNKNYGPRVDEYQMAANKTLGQPWCAKFVYWCFLQAALQLKVANPFPRIFGSAELEKWGKKERRTVVNPIAGDVLVREHRHVALVTAPPREKVIETETVIIVPSIEGNTWGPNPPQHGVWVRDKTRYSNCIFIRL